MGRLYREVLEWFADSSKRVQYPAPELKRLDAEFAQAEKPRFGFKYKMPLYQRIALVTFGLVGVIFGLMVLTVMGFLIAAAFH